jgi:signal transduction histidine kinase
VVDHAKLAGYWALVAVQLTRRTSHDGFGLGFAIVASIAATHGGTATARPPQ